MGTQRTTFEKLQRERAKKAKAAAKREKRQDKGDDDAPESDEPVSHSGATMADLLVEMKTLHQEFDDKAITFEEFEERKEALISQLASLPLA
jgi:hypothetical protein